jgi:hypothetical protein
MVVWGVFANNSADRTRRGRITVYFRPGASFAPPP